MTKRIVTGVGLLGLLVFALVMGGWVFNLLFMGALCMCVFEFFRALKNAGNRPVEWPVWTCMAVSIPIYVFSDRMYITMLLIGAACMLTCANVIFRKVPRLSDLLFSCLPLFSVLVPGLCMLTFQQHAVPALRAYFILISFGIPLMGDTLALFGGRRFGKHALCPEVSPKKTVEGALFGLLGSVLFGVITTLVFSLFVTTPVFWHIAILSLIAGVAGQVGDLFASLVKRDCEIKDFSDVFPGHGGMMDRLDSVFFSTVVVYVYYIFYIGV